jgi:hypothetical protein
MKRDDIGLAQQLVERPTPQPRGPRPLFRKVLRKRTRAWSRQSHNFAADSAQPTTGFSSNSWPGWQAKPHGAF